MAGRTDHSACRGCRQGVASATAIQVQGDDLFWHAPDYAEVRLRGEMFSFTGNVNRGVIRILHEAALAGQPWQSGKLILGRAGSKDGEAKMRNLFGSHPSWGRLLLSDQRGKYSLRIA